jgi:aryl-alcohol dehydrogenase-like predicted oxidoreductase
MIKGKANKHSTNNFSKKFSGLRYNILGDTGLTVSSCGFGGYRVDYRVKEHFDSLEYAILNGVNLIDTSSNYSDGGSEVLTGNVLKKLTDAEIIKRDEEVIVTKGGYIQGKNLEIAEKNASEGNRYEDLIEYADGLWHCIHPEFLKEQINQSLEKLQIETIDVYMLHNPEYFLDSIKDKELDMEELREEYYRRIWKAFEYLENEARNGRISFYGVSSNTFVKENDFQIFTSLEECINAGKKISSENKFKVVQFPLNLFERGAITVKNNYNNTKSLLEVIKENNLGALVNRPLNAIKDDRLKRTADFKYNQEHLNQDETIIVNDIENLENYENVFSEEYLSQFKLDEKLSDAVKQFMTTGKTLKENWKKFGSIENFNDLKKQYLIPRLNFAITTLFNDENANAESREKLKEITKQANKVFSIIESIYGKQANNESKKIHSALNEELKISYQNKPLSQKAISLLSSIDGISSVLVGMRQIAYVDDVVECLKNDRIINAEDILRE